ncbi:hypothetical protein ACJMK2_024293 [Sinanodonta woodiana]|uniref:Uncharacterized protein n=1 Tax=Sinanodonta woodiana TaxID=1069815 RepID=A0ABD3T6X6_SINWO
MNEFKQESSLTWGSPAAWGSPAISPAKLPNPSPRQNAVCETPPKRHHSDPSPYHGAAIQKQSSHSHLNNSGCVPSTSPKTAHVNNPGQNSSTRFRQQRSHFSTPPYHFWPNSGHSFRTPNQLFNSPVRYDSGRQSFGNVCNTESPSFNKSCNPGASNQIENYYQPSMVTDPWKGCKPVVRS